MQRRPDGSIWVGDSPATLLTEALHFPAESALFRHRAVRALLQRLQEEREPGEEDEEDDETERTSLRMACQQALRWGERGGVKKRQQAIGWDANAGAAWYQVVIW